MRKGKAVIEWFVTAPNPRTIDQSADAGQRGWSLHAVDIKDGKTTLGEIRRATAACGLTPAHGWTVDLFITVDNGAKNCKRCERALAKHGKHPHPFEGLTDKEGHYIPLADRRTKR